MYIFYPISKDHFFVFKEVFAENSVLMYGLYPNHVSESSKVLEIPPNFYVGWIRGKQGRMIYEIQGLTGAAINIPIDWKKIALKKKHPNPPETLEISGSPNAVNLAEEFLLAFFKHPDPSKGCDGLSLTLKFQHEIFLMLPNDSILREKMLGRLGRFI